MKFSRATLRALYQAHSKTIIALLVASAFSVVTAYATPPGSPYAAGETLDPTCVPGSSNCTVNPSQWDTVTGGITYMNGNVGIGTDTPDEPLHIKGQHGIKLERDDNPRYAIIRPNPEGGIEYNSAVGVTGLRHDFQIAGVTALGIDASGDVGVKNIDPQYDLDVTGDINASNSICINGDCITSWPTGGGSALLGSTSSILTETWLGTSVADMGTASSAFTVFLGVGAGANATTASQSIFIGWGAGDSATNSFQSIFIGPNAGQGSAAAVESNFIGSAAGANASNAFVSNFIGLQAGQNATNAAQSIFIGNNAGVNDTVNNTATFNESTTFANTSILIGHKTNTGGFSNSIALGAYATNTATNQLMIGSTTRRIDSLVFNGGTGNTCAINASTGISCSSDERLKTNIIDIDTALDDLMNIRTVTYNWKSDPEGSPMIGFVAQNLINYFPQLVTQNIDGMYSVNYAQITPVLARAIQELNIKVTSLTDLTSEDGLGAALRSWFADAGNGIAKIFAGEINADTVKTNNLCVGSVCVTEEQFLHLVNQSGGSTPVPIETPPVVEETPPTDQQDVTTIPGDEPVVEEPAAETSTVVPQE